MDIELVNTEEAAKILNMSKRTLENWRAIGKKGLPYIPIGGVVKYNMCDIVEFIKNNQVG